MNHWHTKPNANTRTSSLFLNRLPAIALTCLATGLTALTVLAAESADPKFSNYTQEIPGSTVTFDMIAVPGGTITIGSPESEAGRDKSDLPAKQVTVKPFWMGKFEVSWPEFVPYVFIDPTNILRQVSKIEGIVDKDSVSHPTKPYGSVYRERGEKGFPAIGMGYPAAAEYCRWLSNKTGRKYRLATEEEWEYACRAGATTPYFWGADAAQAKEYAWYKDDANDSTHPLGKLKPNKFGIYDIVGNVAEWCQQTDTNAPHVARGGAFSEAIAKLRSAARMIETPEWNELDPQFPQSIWWLSAADFVGFRVVRSFDDEAAPAAASPAAGAAATTAGVPAADNDEVKMNYKRYCQGCHGATGKGDTALGKKNKARDYTDAAVKATLKDDAMFKAIKEGLVVDDKHVMSASGDKLTDAQIKALAQYMKSF